MNISFDNATNFRKSLEARLKNIAITTGEDLQRLRRKVAFDRFLACLSLQEEPKFLLKGGYAMELRLSTARATKDIDLTCTSILGTTFFYIWYCFSFECYHSEIISISWT